MLIIYYERNSLGLLLEEIIQHRIIKKFWHQLERLFGLIGFSTSSSSELDKSESILKSGDRTVSSTTEKMFRIVAFFNHMNINNKLTRKRTQCFLLVIDEGLEKFLFLRMVSNCSINFEI